MSENKNVQTQQQAVKAMQQKPKVDLKQYGMLIALGVIIAFFYVLTGGKLLKPMNVSNLIFQNAYVIILAIGMLLCILTGGNIDLSVGSVVGLIGACAKMRPSGSITDMDLKSLKKKYKSKGFAAGCSRDVIAQGAEMLGWELDTLLEKTMDAMRTFEDRI